MPYDGRVPKKFPTENLPASCAIPSHRLTALSPISGAPELSAHAPVLGSVSMSASLPIGQEVGMWLSNLPCMPVSAFLLSFTCARLRWRALFFRQIWPGWNFSGPAQSLVDITQSLQANRQVQCETKVGVMSVQPKQTFQGHTIPDQLDASGWAEPVELADRYLKASGISSSRSRALVIREAFTHLETTNRSLAPRVRTIRMLACLDRVLSRQLKTPDSDDAVAAGRRLLFFIEPSVREQVEGRLRSTARNATVAGGAMADENCELVRIPAIQGRQRMERQVIRFRTIPLASAVKHFFRRRRSPVRS